MGYAKPAYVGHRDLWLQPTGAIGLAYHYILPFQTKATIGAIGYYSLQGMFGSGSTDVSKALTGQASLNYALSGSYGVFIAGDSAGTVSVGLSLLNPVLFPFFALKEFCLNKLIFIFIALTGCASGREFWTYVVRPPVEKTVERESGTAIGEVQSRT